MWAVVVNSYYFILYLEGSGLSLAFLLLIATITEIRLKGKEKNLKLKN